MNIEETPLRALSVPAAFDKLHYHLHILLLFGLFGIHPTIQFTVAFFRTRVES